MRILIAGGGTGGHIYPALAMASAVREMKPDAVIEFAGTPAGLETKLVPKAGYEIHVIPVGKLNRSVGLLQQLKTLATLPWALWRAWQLIRRFRPDLVLGVGGYASGPVVFIAALLRYRTVVWEPNAFPGLANRILSRFVDKSLVVFPEAEKYMAGRHVQHVAMPVRSEIEGVSRAPHADVPFRLLVFGGSQGARAINNAVLEAVQSGSDWLNGIEIVHQTGSLDFARLSQAYGDCASAQDHVTVKEYLHDMPQRYAWADLVIARAGTGTLSELAACSKAAILIPLPSAADDHQTKNAMALVAKGAAVLLPQRELTVARLVQEIQALRKDAAKRRRLEENIRQFHKPGAVREIARILVEKASE